MSAAAHLPDHAPFAPDAIAKLNSVIGHADPAQRAWLSGFLAGLEATRTAPAVAAPPAAKQKLVILFATESGNAEALAATARRDAARAGFAARTLDAADATPAALKDAGTLLVIASTWGEGEAPQRAIRFVDALLADDAPRLDGLRYAVLALGDRAYAQFCETGRVIDERLAALGATRVADRIECDLDYETPAATWLAATLPALREKPDPEASVIHVDFGLPAPGLLPGPMTAGVTKASPFAAQITQLQTLNSSRSNKQTIHVELDIAGSGLAYQPGDAIGVLPQNDPALVDELLATTVLAADDQLRAALLTRHDVATLTAHLARNYAELAGDRRLLELVADPDQLAGYLKGRHVIDLVRDHPARLQPDQLLALLRPLPPRLYSVASSQRATPDEAHLLVSAVRYTTHGRNRAGVASTWLADRRRVGDTVPVYVKPNPHFRLPADPDTPLIMIGPGTGVAPYRAFLQDRDENRDKGARGRTWLFFGDQHYTHDFLYQLEWQDYLKRGVLSRLDVAFSRDQDAKIYVQHRILERAADLHAWLEDGARIYVCGDQQRMAKDVHAALRTVIATGRNLSEDRAEAELATLAAEGRYLRDVY